MARPPRSLDEVTRSIEQSLIPQSERDPRESGAGVSATPAEPTKNSRTRPSEAARPLSEVYSNAAAEIQSTGEAVVQVANDIAAQTQALADLLRKHGSSIADRIEEFASMTKRVADAVQKGRTEVLSAEEGRGEAPGGEPRGTPLVPHP